VLNIDLEDSIPLFMIWTGRHLWGARRKLPWGWAGDTCGASTKQ